MGFGMNQNSLMCIHVNQSFEIVPTVDDVNLLRDEETELKFVTVFRQLLRLLNKLNNLLLTI